jgi:hypothetical protein
MKKKNKKIVKAKTYTNNQAKGRVHTSNSSNDMIKKVAKMVNLKKKERTLT